MVGDRARLQLAVGGGKRLQSFWLMTVEGEMATVESRER